jgi:hypothetical protein
MLALKTIVVQNVRYSTFLAEPMAELVSLIANEFDHTALADDIFRYVAPTDSFAY